MTYPSDHHDRIANDPEYRERWFANLARTVAVDFDGVLHPYTKGWVGPEPDDEPPMPGAEEFLDALAVDGYRIVVFSTRCDTPEGLDGTMRWLEKHGLLLMIDYVTCQKPAAIAYVDDRAVVYRDGNWTQARAEVDRLAEGRAHGAAQHPDVATEPSRPRLTITVEEERDYLRVRAVHDKDGPAEKVVIDYDLPETQRDDVAMLVDSAFKAWADPDGWR